MTMKLNSLKMMGGMILSLMFGMTVFTSCSSDSDGGTNLTDAKYESTAAKYEIQGSSAPYSSIELTASGDYIIIKNSLAASRPFALTDKIASKFIARPVEETRGYASPIIHGKYTKISDTEYKLEGFGTITISNSTSGAYSLEITETGKSTYTLTAAKATQNPSSDITKNLCRTWSFASYRLEMTVPKLGKVLDGEYTFNDEGTDRLNRDLYNVLKSYGAINMTYEQFLKTEGAVEIDASDMPESVIFTKTGTYVVLYANETLAVSTWTWTDESKGILHYSWDYSDMYNKNHSGDIQVSFRGNQLVFRETYGDNGSGNSDKVEGVISYYMNEVQ